MQESFIQNLVYTHSKLLSGFFSHASVHFLNVFCSWFSLRKTSEQKGVSLQTVFLQKHQSPLCNDILILFLLQSFSSTISGKKNPFISTIFPARLPSTISVFL